MLDQEAERQARRQAAPAPPSDAPHDVLPGVGVAARQRAERAAPRTVATLAHAGAIWFFALFEFAVLAVLAPDLRNVSSTWATGSSSTS